MGEKVLKAGFLSQQKNYTGIIIFHTPNQKAKKNQFGKTKKKKICPFISICKRFFCWECYSIWSRTKLIN